MIIHSPLCPATERSSQAFSRLSIEFIVDLLFGEKDDDDGHLFPGGLVSENQLA